MVGDGYGYGAGFGQLPTFGLYTKLPSERPEYCSSCPKTNSGYSQDHNQPTGHGKNGQSADYCHGHSIRDKINKDYDM